MNTSERAVFAARLGNQGPTAVMLAEVAALDDLSVWQLWRDYPSLRDWLKAGAGSDRIVRLAAEYSGTGR